MNEGNVWGFAEEITTVTNNYISHLLSEVCEFLENFIISCEDSPG